jgi:hypothetical protein
MADRIKLGSHLSPLIRRERTGSMLPNVAIISRPTKMRSTLLEDPSSPFNDPAAARRRHELAAEARRLARRRMIAQAVARRSRENDRGLRDEASDQLFRRARRKATRVGLVFHQAIEALWAAGGFDEALAIFREHKREHERRLSHFARTY